MSPRCDTRAAKLIIEPRPLLSTAGSQVSYSTRESVRLNLVAYPSTGTGASAVGGPGLPGHTVYHPQDKRTYRPSPEGALRRYRRDGGTPPTVMPGSMLIPGAPHAQRCGDPDPGAGRRSPVVAPHHASQDSISQKRRSAAWMGNRRPVQISTLDTVSREVGFEGG